jgi:hypothetical protein
MKKDKETPKHYWNHRIVTEMKPDVMDRDSLGNTKFISKSFRVFSITEVHYEDDKPVAYGMDMNVMSGWETLKDLKGTYDMLASAFEKPVLDKNNWPNEWKPEE